MVQASQHWQFTAKVIAFVSLITWAVALLSVQVLTPANILPALGYLTTAAGAGYMAALALNKWLWRWPGIRALVRIPDLSGRWEGWQFRTLDGVWVPTAHEVSQRALDIAAEAWGQVNWARGTSASIITDSHGAAVEFVWTYKAQVISPPVRPGDAHSGTHYLRFSERDGRSYLDGTYANDRLRTDETLGAVGFIRLIRVGPLLKGSLAFTDEKSWGMAKPQDDPTS